MGSRFIFILDVQRAISKHYFHFATTGGTRIMRFEKDIHIVANKIKKKNCINYAHTKCLQYT